MKFLILFLLNKNIYYMFNTNTNTINNNPLSTKLIDLIKQKENKIEKDIKSLKGKRVNKSSKFVRLKEFNIDDTGLTVKLIIGTKRSLYRIKIIIYRDFMTKTGKLRENRVLITINEVYFIPEDDIYLDKNLYRPKGQNILLTKKSKTVYIDSMSIIKVNNSKIFNLSIVEKSQSNPYKEKILSICRPYITIFFLILEGNIRDN